MIIAHISLHISMGTFKPISHEDFTQHHMDAESFEILESEAQKVNLALRSGKRIITVGTTATRVVENCQECGQMKSSRGKTDLFIYPGYQFNIVNSLISNFHMPKSTPLLLVSAFAGRDLIRNAYQHAIRNEYHFYSYGDSMMIL